MDKVRSKLFARVMGNQYFDNDVQSPSIFGVKKEIYVSTDGETIEHNKSGAVVIIHEDTDVKLPKPEPGLNYRFITTGSVSGTSTITSTHDGITSANLLSGLISQNGAIATAADDDVLTFANGAGAGDYCDVECLGEASSDVKAFTTLQVADSDAGDGTTNGEKITLISADGTSVTYVICDGNATTTETGHIIHDALDIGSGTATSLGAPAGSIAVTIENGAKQAAIANELKAAITGSSQYATSSILSAGHTDKFTFSADLNPASTGTKEKITVTNVTSGLSGLTVVTNNIANLTVGDFSGSANQDFKWHYYCYTAGANKITAG